MLYLRTALLTLGVILVVLLVMMVMTFDADYELNKAVELFQQEDLSLLKQKLNQLERSVPEKEIALCFAYLYREKGALNKSNEQLERASFRDQKGLEIAFEIDCNCCFNSYLEQKWSQLATQIKEMRNRYGKRDWITLFQALVDLYKEGNFSSAANVFQKSRSPAPLSLWMKKSFSLLLSSDWREIQLARCRIEMDDYLKVRQELENHKSYHSETLEAERSLLIGLTYLKESAIKPLGVILSYHKLALSHFNKLPIHHQRYREERSKILDQFSEQAHQLLINKQFQHLPFYLSLFRQWEEEERGQEIIAQLSLELEEAVLEHETERVNRLASLLEKTIDDSMQRNAIAEKVFFVSLKQVEKNAIFHLEQYLQIAKRLNSNFNPCAISVTDRLWDHLLSLLKSDSFSYENLYSLVKVWSSLEKRIDRRVKATEILTPFFLRGIAEKDHNIHSSCLNCLHLVSDLYTTPKEAQKCLSALLSNAYLEAAQKKHPERLLQYLDAIETLSLVEAATTDLPLQSLLKGIESLIKQGNLKEAQAQISWLQQHGVDHANIH